MLWPFEFQKFPLHASLLLTFEAVSSKRNLEAFEWNYPRDPTTSVEGTENLTKKTKNLEGRSGSLG